MSPNEVIITVHGVHDDKYFDLLERERTEIITKSALQKCVTLLSVLYLNQILTNLKEMREKRRNSLILNTLVV